MESIRETPLSSVEPYQSPQFRAKLVIGALSACIVMDVLSGILEVGYTITGSGRWANDADLNVYAMVVGLFGLGVIVVNLSAVVFFMMWFHCVYKNLTPLGATGLQYSPGWTIGAWFIPFGNLFIPYRIAKEVWLKSVARTEEFAFLNTESTVPAIIGLWWGFWLASNISAHSLAKIGAAIGKEAGALFMALAAEALSILAAAFAIRLIKMITARQEESSTQLFSYSPPPPPAVYESLTV